MPTRLFTTLSAVVFLAGPVAGALWAEDPPPSPTNIPATTTIGRGTAEATLDAAGGSPIVTAQINGRGPFRILIDTARQRMVVDDDLIQSALLKPSGTTRSPEATGHRAGPLRAVRIGTVVMGSALFSGIDAAVVDLDRQAGGKRSYDAAVGLPFFTNCVVTINYIGGKLLLRKGELPGAGGPHVLAYTLERGRPIITVGSGDRTFTTAIETASLAGLVLSPKDREKVPTQTLFGLVGDPRRFICDVDIVTPRTKEPIILAGVRLSAVPVSVGSVSSSLGRDVLRLFSLSFDVKHGRVRLRSPADAVDLTPVSRFGYVFSRQDDDLVVDAIFPGSLAEGEAASEGDHIQAVEHKPPSAYGDAALRRMLRTEKSLLFIVDKQGMPLMVVVHSTDY